MIMQRYTQIFSFFLIRPSLHTSAAIVKQSPSCPTFLSFFTQAALFGMQIICINTALGLDFSSKGCFQIKTDKAAREVCIQEVRNYPFTISFFPPCPKAIAKHRNTACYT